ncbi:MAG TPA: hypothetical protein VII78_07775 [Myxococcota bacterium]|jgi:hypothetical protein
MTGNGESLARRSAPYVPLLVHLLPTLAIGYLVVIPRSCIAGVNELTLGFAAANAGFALSYVAGVRLAARRARGDA